MRVLFVTNELFPFAPGGIGRLIHNYIVWNAAQDRPVEIHVLMLDAPRMATWSGASLAGATIHDADRLGALTPAQQQSIAASESPTFGMLHMRSKIAANAIERLFVERDLAFDVIEFPDYLGIAMASLRRRAEGSEALAGSRLAVRLHSSMTLIQADEGAAHLPSEWFAAVTDSERYCLRHADVVVGHLPALAELNRRAFGFDEAWERAVHIEFPPILLTEEERETRSLTVARQGRPQTFLFSSRLQPFKRPDLFLRAAVCYLRRNPQRADRCLIVSYGWDPGYNAWLASLVPEDLADRIEIRTGLSQAERARLMATSTIVVPSTFESLCIFAYESYLFGRCVILNGTAAAFGDSTFWRDGANCLKFDGSVEGLALAMERSADFLPRPDEPLPETRPYWLEARRPYRKAAPPTIDLVASRVAPGQPASPLADELRLASPGLRAFLFKDRLFDPEPAAGASPHVAVIENFGADILPESLRRALETSAADYVILADPEAEVSSVWLERVGGALARHEADMIAFPWMGPTDEVPRPPNLDAPNLVAHGCGFAFGPVVLRRTLALERLASLGPDDDWLLGRLVLGIALSDAAVHVLDLPVRTPPRQALHRRPLFHYLADMVSRLNREALPQLGAFSVGLRRKVGVPYVDEWAVVERARPRDAVSPQLRSGLADVELHGVEAGPSGLRAWGRHARPRAGTAVAIRFTAELVDDGLHLRVVSEAASAPDRAPSDPVGATERHLEVQSWRAVTDAAGFGDVADLLDVARDLCDWLPEAIERFDRDAILGQAGRETRLLAESARLQRVLRNAGLVGSHERTGSDDARLRA